MTIPTFCKYYCALVKLSKPITSEMESLPKNLYYTLSPHFSVYLSVALRLRNRYQAHRTSNMRI